MSARKLLAVGLLIAPSALQGCEPKEPEPRADPVATAPAQGSSAVPAPVSAVASAAPATSASATTVAGLTITEPRLVCMINDQFMGREQIPVKVGEKTYYGCCPMCKTRLAKEAKARMASDPGTGREVDKSEALIARKESGEVLYFENRESFTRYATAQN